MGSLGHPDPRTHRGSLEHLRNQGARAWPLPHLPRRTIGTARSAVSVTQEWTRRDPLEAGPLEVQGLFLLGQLLRRRSPNYSRYSLSCAGSSCALGSTHHSGKSHTLAPLKQGRQSAQGAREGKVSGWPGSGSPPGLLRGRRAPGIHSALLAMGGPGVLCPHWGLYHRSVTAEGGCAAGSRGVLYLCCLP